MESSIPSSSAVLVVSTVLGDFFAKHSDNNANVLLPTAKILRTLLQNAVAAASNENDNEQANKYRKIRLSNPKIQQRIVQVADALDILALAGFAAVDEGGEHCLVYTPPNGSHEIAHAICHQLETKIQELERLLLHSSQESTKTKAVVSTKSSSSLSSVDNPSSSSSPFLSEEERQKRLAQAKAARKASAAQRAATQRRWEEDRLERQEAAKRKEQQQAVLAAAAATSAAPLATGLTVRQLATSRRIKDPPVEQSETKNINNSMDISFEEQVVEESGAAAAATHASSMMMDDADSVQSCDGDLKKLPAAAAAIMPPHPDDDAEADKLWNDCTRDLSSCEAANGIRDTSVFKTKPHPSDARPVTCLKRLYQELKELSTSLPKERLSSIWVRFEEETPQYLRALIAASPLGGTPYAGGLFCFDIFVPNDYPNLPPSVVLLTTGGGRVRFGPNLYADGKVCLSLLGTWPGPKWSPSHSNLYQVLVSIQGLILGAEQPWFLEPGHGGWEGNVKEGDYVKQGKTLTGKVVRTEVGLPPQVQQYNNVLRVGTVRFAILEALSGTTQRHLQVLALPIHVHFFCNRSAILNEVRSWPIIMDPSQQEKMDVDEEEQHPMPFRRMGQPPPGDLKTLLPQLEERLFTLVHPSRTDAILSCGEKMAAAATALVNNDMKMAPSNEKADSEIDSMQVDISTKAAAPAAALLETDARSTMSSSKTHTDILRSRMQEAAGSGNFILAGHLQEQLNQLEDLERRMQEAASEGNYIRAGRLQEQIQALMNTDDKDSGPSGSATWSYDKSAQEDDGDDDDSGMMGTAGGLAMGKHVFAPPGHPSSYASGNHRWGSGSALSSTTQKPAAATPPLQETASNIAIKKKAPPSSSGCRLRIRLPESKSCVEDFDRNDPLSIVYSRLESIMSTEGQSDQGPRTLGGGGSQPRDVAPPVRIGGAFAQPQSLPGFTLLLSHPKQEFSLEMHGTKTLTELGLVPSATLTVMKCSDRGLVYRGELESRLTAAHGNAMDVEGLTYEGLLELTERVGAAKPKAITKETLDRNSILLSPSNLEAKKEGDGHCPICLGEFDPTDTNKTLRKLNQCGHVFHAACFATWLGTKSSCPLCKSPLDKGEEASGEETSA